MDRFIDANFDTVCLRTLDLKSNMDRFIESDTQMMLYSVTI